MYRFLCCLHKYQTVFVEKKDPSNHFKKQYQLTISKQVVYHWTVLNNILLYNSLELLLSGLKNSLQ